MPKYLIINCDDFGSSHAANEAIVTLLDEGAVTSATAMAPCAWFPEAAEYARTHPDKCVGLHLTFTSEWDTVRWGPVGGEAVDSLVDSTGRYFPRDCLSVESNARPEQVRREILAQLALARSLGLEPSHMDNHMGSLYGVCGVQGFLDVVFPICAANGFPFRLPTQFLPGDAIGDHLPQGVKDSMAALKGMAAAARVPVLDCLLTHDFAGAAGETYASFRDHIIAKLFTIPEGLHEIYIHPAMDGSEIRHTTSTWQRRVWEFQLFRDGAVRRALDDAGLTVISWRDVPALTASIA